MPRMTACFSLSGRNRSTTSIAEPNSISWMARRSFSSAAQAYISSMVFGSASASKRPSALPGPVLHAYRLAMAITASMPCFSLRWVIIAIGSLWKIIASSPFSPRLTDMISDSMVGRVSRPSSLLIFCAVGKRTDPAISYLKPSISSTVADMPPL